MKTARVVRPRPPTLTSIPSLLGVFQEEWDALALETYTLRQALVQTRQELSTALYQHDAAVRVIARLTKERDEARDTLSKISVGAARAPAGGDAMQVDSAKLPDSVVAKIEETHAKYVHRLYLFKITLLTIPDSLSLGASVRSQKAGQRAKQSSHTSQQSALSLFILEANHSLWTRLVIWH